MTLLLIALCFLDVPALGMRAMSMWAGAELPTPAPWRRGAHGSTGKRAHAQCSGRYAPRDHTDTHQGANSVVLDLAPRFFKRATICVPQVSADEL